MVQKREKKKDAKIAESKDKDVDCGTLGWLRIKRT